MQAGRGSANNFEVISFNDMGQSARDPREVLVHFVSKKNCIWSVRGLSMSVQFPLKFRQPPLDGDWMPFEPNSRLPVGIGSSPRSKPGRLLGRDVKRFSIRIGSPWTSSMLGETALAAIGYSRHDPDASSNVASRLSMKPFSSCSTEIVKTCLSCSSTEWRIPNDARTWARSSDLRLCGNAGLMVVKFYDFHITDGCLTGHCNMDAPWYYYWRLC